MTAMLLIHLVATVFMTGLVWFVQCVHYPLMVGVEAGHLASYVRRHMERTSWVVLPAMIAEATSAAALVYMFQQTGDPARFFLACLGAALLMGIWLSTAVAMRPCYRQLEDQPDPQMVRQLVQGNWLRTVLWSVRSALAVVLLLQSGGR